jgi:hypothetical protein
MANRTVQIQGQGYGSATCSATVSFNGNVVFSGSIPTINQETINYLPDEQVVLLTFEVPVELSGTFPVSITVTGGNAVYVEQVSANYVEVPNPIYTPEQYLTLTDSSTTSSEKIAIYTPLAVPPLSAEDITVLESGTVEEKNAVLDAHGLSLLVPGGSTVFGEISQPQSKTTVYVNGQSEPLPSPLPPESAGEWGYVVPIVDGTGTTTFNLIVDAGVE